MTNQILNDIYRAQLSNDQFNKLSNFIYQESGIKMPPVKRIMLQSRLQKRLKELNLTSFKEYCEYVFSKDGLNNEVIHMLDVVSTNKTDFFREPAHFDFITNTVLPQFYNENQSNRYLKVWSAGSSSGEEAYTLAIVLFEFASKHSGFDFSITGTDISTKILQHAINAIYKEDRIERIPYELKKKYFLKSKDKMNPTVKMASHVRHKVTFSRLNFMDTRYDLPDTFNIVFCRNVLIYFDKDTQEKVINKICSKLKTGGYFFLGHSESIMNMNVPLNQIKPTIFRKI